MKKITYEKRDKSTSFDLHERDYFYAAAFHGGLTISPLRGPRAGYGFINISPVLIRNTDY